MLYLRKRIINRLGKLSRYIYRNNFERKKLKNKYPTIISQNCMGGIIYNDLGLKFNSPTINLYMNALDFIKFVQNIDYYLEKEIKEDKSNENIDYPVGIIEDITINFVHYKSFEEAVKKWNSRKHRINKENIFIIMSQRDGCTDNIVKKFDELPYKNKVIFTCKKYEYKSAICLEMYKGYEEVGIITEITNIFGKRIFQKYFNHIDWLNNKN